MDGTTISAARPGHDDKLEKPHLFLNYMIKFRKHVLISLETVLTTNCDSINGKKPSISPKMIESATNLVPLSFPSNA